MGETLGDSIRKQNQKQCNPCQKTKTMLRQARRSELQGGGLVRSAGGNKVGLLGRKKEEREKGDDRILGSGDFACPVKCLCFSI